MIFVQVVQRFLAVLNQGSIVFARYKFVVAGMLPSRVGLGFTIYFRNVTSKLGSKIAG